MSHHLNNQSTSDYELFGLHKNYGKDEKSLVNELLRYTNTLPQKLHKYQKSLAFILVNPFVATLLIRAYYLTIGSGFFFFTYSLFGDVFTKRFVNYKKSFILSTVPFLTVVSLTALYSVNLFLAYALSIFIGYSLIYMVAFFNHNNTKVVYYTKESYQYYQAIDNISNVSLGAITDFFTLSFSRYHQEHHWAPSLPFYRLAALSEKLAPIHQITLFTKGEAYLEALKANITELVYEDKVLKRDLPTKVEEPKPKIA